MARKTSDREDLLRDGVQMPIRGQADLAGNELFVGLRRTGQVSLYWNQDPVYQFNSHHALRRVFFRGIRYAAFERRLRRLDVTTEDSANRDATKLSFAQTNVDDALESEIMAEFFFIRKQILDAAIVWQVVGAESSQTFDLLIRAWLERVGDKLEIATVPNA